MLGAGKVSGDAPKKDIGQLIQESFARCQDELSGDATAYGHCMTYAEQCIMQSTSEDSSFEICAKTGECESTRSLDACVGFAVFLAAEYGEPAPLKSKEIKKVEAKKEAPPEKIDIGIWKAGDEVFARLTKIKGFEDVDRAKYNVYYINADSKATETDLVLVDRIDVERDPGFCMDRPTPEDKIVSLKAGKVVGEKDKGVQRFLKSFRLPSIDNINIEKLVAYIEVLKVKVKGLKTVVDAGIDVKAIGETYEAIVDAASAVYFLDMDVEDIEEYDPRKGAFEKILEANLSKMEGGWSAPLQKAIVKMMGGKAVDFLRLMALYQAGKGEVAKMEETIKAAISKGFDKDSPLIDVFRTKGYGIAIQKAVGVVDESFTKDTDKKIIYAGIVRVEELLKTKNFAKTGQLFSGDKPIYMDGALAVTSDALAKKVDEYKIKLCARVADRIIADLSVVDGLRAIPPNVREIIMALPATYRVADIERATAMLDGKMSVIKKDGAKKKIEARLGYAKSMYDRKPEDKSRSELVLGRASIQDDPRDENDVGWWFQVNTALDQAAEAAAGADLVDEYAVKIDEIRKKAFRERFNFWKIQILSELKQSTSELTDGWYTEVVSEIKYMRELHARVKLLQPDVVFKGEIENALNQFAVRADVGRAGQLLRIAGSAIKLLRVQRGEDGHFEKAQQKLAKAEAFIKEKKVEDTEVVARLQKLSGDIYANQIDVALKVIEGQIGDAVFFEYPSLEMNGYLYSDDPAQMNYNRELDKILKVAEASGREDEFKAKVAQLRRGAYSVYLDGYERKITTLIKVPREGEELRYSDWYKELSGLIDTAMAYVTAEYNGQPVFEADIVEQKRATIAGWRQLAIEKESQRLIELGSDKLGLDTPEFESKVRQAFTLGRELLIEAGKKVDDLNALDQVYSGRLMSLVSNISTKVKERKKDSPEDMIVLLERAITILDTTMTLDGSLKLGFQVYNSKMSWLDRIREQLAELKPAPAPKKEEPQPAPKKGDAPPADAAPGVPTGDLDIEIPAEAVPAK